MNKRQLLRRLDQAWTTFTSSYAGLSGAQVLEPGVTGKWSVRDIIAHVTTWEQEALKHLPLVLKGGRPPRYSVTHGGIDAFNALTTEEKKHLPLSAVLRQQDQMHAQLIEFIEAVSEDHFIGETPFRHRLRLDTYGHYPKHCEPIRKWRERHGRQIDFQPDDPSDIQRVLELRFSAA
jgi:DinB superfamily